VLPNRRNSADTYRHLAKIYVQDLVWDLRDTLTKLILEKRAYIYICGDAKHMAKSVEEVLMKMLGEAKGGTAEVEGAKEFKLLKERNVCRLVCGI
jgi:NADPH-ferrihemoprotein reductase